jgi:3-oxoacyl-[acyl-carrier protein] reductase
MDLGLRNRNALVTGGSKGIGFACADELAAEGAAVAICARTLAELRTAAAAIEERTPSARIAYYVTDVTDPAQVLDLVDRVAKEFGGIDILVNNAGRAHPGDFESLTDDDWQNDVNVKLLSQIRCVRAALPYLRVSEAARVVNINAVFAKGPDSTFFATSVVRAACLNLSKALAQEFGADGILVNSVNIGFVDTPQWDNIHASRGRETNRGEFLRALAEQDVPLGRFGTADEVSGIVAFLAGTRASYISGAAIDVSGGMGKYV